MVIQKSLSYLFARGIPGIISLISIMVYTRILSPEVYGQYTIVISLIVLTITMFFQWMQFAMLRFHPKENITENVLISNIIFLYLLFSVIIIPIFIFFLYLSFDFLSFPLLVIILFLTFFHGFFDISLQVSVCRGDSLYYGIILLVKSVCSLLIGLLFFYYGYLLTAPLAGLTFTYLVLSIILINKYCKSITLKVIDTQLIKSMMYYGIPLSGTFLMNFVMSNSDRLMLAYMEGEKSAGLYAAGYDLSNFILIVLLMSIHLAIYPMIVKEYENKNINQCNILLNQNLTIILLISTLPIIIFTFLVNDFSQLVFGEHFWEVASNVIPIITFATFFLGLKAYYFDLAFLLTHKTKYLLIIGFFGALLNLFFNYIFIIQWGVIGAAYATLLSYFFILLLSIGMGRFILKIPIPQFGTLKVFFLFLLCSSLVYLSQHYLGDHVILNLLILISSYTLLVYLFNFLNCQYFIKQLFSSLFFKIRGRN
jgi:O-antigen/teichoic acid export membrane protein